MESMTEKSLKFFLVIGIVIVIAFVAFSFSGLSFLDSLEKGAYDAASAFMQKGREGGGPVVSIEIDEHFSVLDRPRVSRLLLADLISLLDEKGARLVGLTFPLNEEGNRTGLHEIRKFHEKFATYARPKTGGPLRTWVLENLTQLEESLDHDRRLIDAVKGTGRVILSAFIREGDEKAGEPDGEQAVIFKNSLGQQEIPASIVERHRIPGLFAPFPELSQVASGLAHGTLIRGKEGGRDFHPLFVSYKGSILPSLPLRMAIAYANMQPSQVLVEENRIRFGEAAIPTIKGEMLLLLSNPEGDHPRYSLSEILKNKTLQEQFRDKIVLIGFGSNFSNPFHLRPTGLTGLEMTARVLNNILDKNIIARPPWMPYLEILILIMAGCYAAFTFPRTAPAQRLIWTLVLGFLVMISGMVLFSTAHLWMRSIYIVACVVILYLLSTFVDLVRAERVPRESTETNRLLGLSYQSQGLLDLALEEFKKLPTNLEAKELIYDLGLEFERKRMINKAFEAYEYIAAAGGFRDVSDRIARLNESEKTSTIGGPEGLTEESGQPDSASEIRTKVGRYEIIEELGKGAMGLVYKALDPKINRLLAIKTIRFSDEFDEDIIQEIKERFFREAEIAGQLSHPSIVTIYDVGEDGDLTYMVMEYLEGRDLEKFILKKQLLPFRKVLEVVASIADALEFAHQEDVIHRDIKPANIMLLKSGGVKVTDFGIAKAISSSRTKTGVILGTPNYMSPEQIMGQKIDRRSDIFSLGVLFYQLLVGETPFHGDNLSSLLYQITQVKHPSVRDYNPKIPRICEQILDKALAKNPDERFRRAGEMSKYLRLLASKMDEVSKKRAS